MTQINGLQEMRFLAQSGGDAARLAALARDLELPGADRDPTLPEWEALLLELHRAIVGPRIHAELTCPECDERVALIFAVDDLPRETEPKTGMLCGHPIRPLRLSDLIAVEAAPRDDRMRVLLSRATGQPEHWALDVLASGQTAAEAQSTLEQALSGLDLQLATACTECNADIVQPFDVQSFVLADRIAAARQLLDEVHTIAKSYHWSETEILSLPRSRRQAYLSRIDRDDLQLEMRDVGY